VFCMASVLDVAVIGCIAGGLSQPLSFINCRRMETSPSHKLLCDPEAKT
jgi:hypothetical protein